MKHRTFIWYLSLALLYTSVVVFGLWLYANMQPVVKLVPYIDPNYVQPPCEAQRRLKEQGFYHGNIDSIWGPESDKAYCNWNAVKEIEE